jgi:hypothetical protein
MRLTHDLADGDAWSRPTSAPDGTSTGARCFTLDPTRDYIVGGDRAMGVIDPRPGLRAEYLRELAELKRRAGPLERRAARRRFKRDVGRLRMKYRRALLVTRW